MSITYKLGFDELALVEWNNLDNSLREPLKKKLIERLKNPHVAATRLSGIPDCCKIKLLRIGYRLVYRVNEDVVFVTVIAVGKRDKHKNLCGCEI